MDKWSLFQRFLITENAQISIWDFVANSIIVLILSIILEFTYSRCAKSLSGRKIFASNFLLIAFTTMLIISIVKSSLALSLGLVGALSIVRFRSAIKEPEELAYLFFTISVGLGLGANQRIITLLAFVILMGIIWGRSFVGMKKQRQNLYLTVNAIGANKPTLSAIEALVKENFKAYNLNRFDESGEQIEVAYWVEIKQSSDLEQFNAKVQQMGEGIRVAFIDNKSF
ncbi:DUF4956 domain-containing protein [Prolixibacteraceae bacterium JC049]|nr:DUF4956 domain-containing protein [Prolixibacteraceae bacterium JC049]